MGTPGFFVVLAIFFKNILHGTCRNKKTNGYHEHILVLWHHLENQVQADSGLISLTSGSSIFKVKFFQICRVNHVSLTVGPGTQGHTQLHPSFYSGCCAGYRHNLGVDFNMSASSDLRTPRIKYLEWIIDFANECRTHFRMNGFIPGYKDLTDIPLDSNIFEAWNIIKIAKTITCLHRFTSKLEVNENLLGFGIALGSVKTPVVLE